MTTVFHKNLLDTMLNNTLKQESFDNDCSGMNDVSSSGILVEAESLIESNESTESQSLDITISNVVCNFSVGCHVRLKEIAQKGINVEYKKEHGQVVMKLRKPNITASIWSSGKITCTGATSEEEAKFGARRVARVVQKLGFDAKFRKMRIVNVLGTCIMPFEIRILPFSECHREAEYEPELHPGVTYKVQDLKATLKIFSTGSITVTAPSVTNVDLAIQYIYPKVYEFRKERTTSLNDGVSKNKRALSDDLIKQEKYKRRKINEYPLDGNVSDVQSNIDIL